MNLYREIIFLSKNLVGIIVLSALMISCESNLDKSHWFEDDVLTISQYIERNQEDYSKFYKILDKGRLLGTIGAYNPYAGGYTLFLPTNEAIDRFIQQSQDYGSFEELLLDTSFIYKFSRYHTINEKVHSYDFPFGALPDKTLSGDRLAISFYTEGENVLIKVNYVAPIIKADLEMVNGYIHVISEALTLEGSSGYEWLQNQDDYSILTAALELAEIKDKLWLDKYTLLVEHDSVYHRNGIYTVDDLFERVVPPGDEYTNRTIAFNRFAAYHIMKGEYYLNDLYWGKEEYQTLASIPIVIDVGSEIKINPGVDTYGTSISEYGDTLLIDYVRPVWDDCNIMTHTGPVHSISDVLVIEPLRN